MEVACGWVAENLPSKLRRRNYIFIYKRQTNNALHNSVVDVDNVIVSWAAGWFVFDCVGVWIAKGAYKQSMAQEDNDFFAANGPQSVLGAKSCKPSVKEETIQTMKLESPIDPEYIMVLIFFKPQ